MRHDKYCPRDIEEIEDKISIVNEPLSAPDGTVALQVWQRERPLQRWCVRA